MTTIHKITITVADSKSAKGREDSWSRAVLTHRIYVLSSAFRLICYSAVNSNITQFQLFRRLLPAVQGLTNHSKPPGSSCTVDQLWTSFFDSLLSQLCCKICLQIFCKLRPIAANHPWDIGRYVVAVTFPVYGSRVQGCERKQNHSNLTVMLAKYSPHVLKKAALIIHAIIGCQLVKRAAQPTFYLI